MEIKTEHGRLIIELSNYGYLMFEPLDKTNDNQRYSITLKINDAMVVTGRMMSSGIDIKKLFEYEMINAIDSMKQTLNNIQNEIRNTENKTQGVQK